MAKVRYTVAKKYYRKLQPPD